MPTVKIYRVTKGATDGLVSWTECEGFQGPSQLLNSKLTSIIFEAQVGTVSAPIGATIDILGDGSSDCLGTGNSDVIPTTTTTTTTTSTTTTTQAPAASFTLSYDASSALTACNNYATSTATYYARAGSNFVNSTQLFTNSILTNKAPDGYYSNGSYFGIVASQHRQLQLQQLLQHQQLQQLLQHQQLQQLLQHQQLQQLQQLQLLQHQQLQQLQLLQHQHLHYMFMHTMKVLLI